MPVSRRSLITISWYHFNEWQSITLKGSSEVIFQRTKMFKGIIDRKISAEVGDMLDDAQNGFRRRRKYS